MSVKSNSNQPPIYILPSNGSQEQSYAQSLLLNYIVNESKIAIYSSSVY